MNARSNAAWGGQGAQRAQRRAQPQFDPVGEAGLLPVGRRQRGPVRIDIAADQPPSLGQAAGQADRGIPGEGADLNRLARADQTAQQGHERALLRADLQDYAVGETPRRLLGQVPQQRVRRAAVRDDVLMDSGADMLGSRGPGSRLPVRPAGSAADPLWTWLWMNRWTGALRGG